MTPPLNRPSSSSARGRCRVPRASKRLAARTALRRLGGRARNRQADLPELVATYKRTRLLVDAGHGPKPNDAPGKS